MRGQQAECFKNTVIGLKDKCNIVTRGLIYAAAGVVSTNPSRLKSGVASPVCP